MELKPGEYICEKCEGTGNNPPMKRNGKYLKPGVYEICGHCHGEGKLDWIENVVGKKQPMVDMTRNLNVQFFAKKPRNPKDGNAYVDKQTGNMNIYESGNWISISPQPKIG